MTQVYYFL